ncbi:STAS domain-containing protein [Actinomadura terrae]|uniref:STAS domain-containing protein n=1 Tax=Actinomadura terrae TaxID=604353 RepID=UPI001FA7F788|nr:STAS domain-containing protein [Actinomadura terrae]
MTVWRITGEDGPVRRFASAEGTGPAGPPGPPQDAPRYDVVEYDTALLRIVSSSGSPWLRLTGDIDVSNSADLDGVLCAAVERVPGDLHLDLAHVDFVDVAGLRVFTKTGHALDAGRRMLLLHSVSPHIDKLVRLIGWDRAPGLLVHCKSRPRA